MCLPSVVAEDGRWRKGSSTGPYSRCSKITIGLAIPNGPSHPLIDSHHPLSPLLYAQLIHSKQASPFVLAFTIVTLLLTSGLTRRDMDVPPCKPGMGGSPSRRGAKRWVGGSTHAAFFPRLLFLFFLSLITLSQRARATCTGDITFCRFFYPDSPSPVIEEFSDPNLIGVINFQCSAVASLGGPFAVSDFKYSYDGITFIPFSDPTTLEGIRRGSRVYSDIQYIDPIPIKVFYISYTLPVGVPIGTGIEVRFLSNQDGYEVDGILLDDFNNAVTVNRKATAVLPTPAPTPAPVQVSMKIRRFVSFPPLLPSFLSPSFPSFSTCLWEERNISSDD